MKPWADHEFIVYWNDTPMFVLNRHLMERQNALANLEDIKTVHQTKLDIYDAIRYESDPRILRSFANDLTLCEFELQKLWKFPEDARFHRFWETPRCECPKMDNEERYGTSYSAISLGCKLHGRDS